MRTIEIEVNDKLCLPYCSGLVVSSFLEFERDINLTTIFSRHEEEYGKLTDWFPFPKSLKEYFYPEEETKNPIRFVRIFFDTPSIERITKDRAAKFVDMLSAIGGTMGLLTGFSIISGVEIIYFAAKIVLCCLMKNRK